MKLPRKHRIIAIAFGVATLCFAPVLFMETSATPVFAATTAPSAAMVAVLPSGTTLGLSQTFKLGTQEMAVITTQGSPTEDRPWIIVAKRNSDNQAWDPVAYLQTEAAWKADSLVLGPQHGQKRAVAISFVVDGATGIMHNVYTLDVSTQGLDVVKVLPEVIEMQAIKESQSGFQINAFNLQVEMTLSGQKWAIQSTGIHQVLKGASREVGFVMGQAPVGNKASNKIYVVGSPSLTMHVGQSLSFIPWNASAASHLLGTYANLGSNQNISVYAAVPGGGELQFYQAAQVMSNQYKFSEPGKFQFAIVPPGYTGMTPDATCAIITVTVTK